MCDEARPRVALMVIGIEGLADLVSWVRAGDTLEEREQRGVFAKECVSEALAGVEHGSFNAALREALSSNQSTDSISRSPVTSAWRN